MSDVAFTFINRPLAERVMKKFVEFAQLGITLSREETLKMFRSWEPGINDSTAKFLLDEIGFI